MTPEAALAIAGMALVTYGVRAGGFLLSAYIPQSGFAAAWLRHLPGTMLAAIVAPSVLTGGPVESAAAVLTVVTAVFTRNLFVAMAVGTIAVWVGRSLIPLI
jgi:branched-subunit amino acid transport protein